LDVAFDKQGHLQATERYHFARCALTHECQITEQQVLFWKDLALGKLWFDILQLLTKHSHNPKEPFLFLFLDGLEISEKDIKNFN
jgi:hypothetical protein